MAPELRTGGPPSTGTDLYAVGVLALEILAGIERANDPLRDLAQSLKVAYGADKSGETGVSISTAFFSLDVPRSIVDKVRNSFGVRSTLCKLLMAPRGQKALEKLLAMLGEGRSLLGRNVLQELRSRYSADEPTGTEA